MYSFKNDYSDGGHPHILKILSQTAELQDDGYGDDSFTTKAKDLLKNVIGNSNIDIHFIVGGTLTNLVALSSFLRPHEAVISAQSGHIYIHETGAIEATGHKILPIESQDGKLKPNEVRKVVSEHHFEHMVKPRLLFISQSTEVGTVYSLNELKELRFLCDELGLLLYLDGARLGSALCSKANTANLQDISNLCDAFYIGGTKNGAMFGEALIISNDKLKPDFRYFMKQKGALLAKGRLLSQQFLTLFQDNLYFELANHGNKMAEAIQDAIISFGYKLKFISHTNQIFPILPVSLVKKLEENFTFYRWGNDDNGLITIRLICSWNTKECYVNDFIKELVI